jgi:hypothetical protein
MDDLASELSAQGVVVRSPVTPDQIDSYAQISQVERENARHAAILEAWKTQHGQEINLRERYAFFLLGLMAVQVLLVNIAFFLIGFGYMTIDEWTARTFMMAVFAELAAMTFWIVKYLFPPATKSILELLK